MFGTLKPAPGLLDARARGEWQRLYCGTCQSLGEHFGHAHRGLLSHDAVFLAALVDGLQDHGARNDRCRCPLLPVVHRPTLSPDSIAMRYAASVQILLADQWLADRAIDGRSLAGAARSLLNGASDRARTNLAELGSSLAELDGFELRQVAAELPGTTGPREAAEPTAAALALVFDRIAELPGESGIADERSELARLGRSVGTAIYLIDALEDLERDLREDAFNPCLVHDFAGRSRLAPARVNEACSLLEQAVAELAATLAGLPLRRHRALLHNVLLVQLRSRSTLAMQSARKLVREGPRSWWTRMRERLQALRRRPPLWRLAQSISAAGLATAAILWSRFVRAAPPAETGTDTETDTGTDTDTSTDTGTDTAGSDTEASEAAEKLDLGGPANLETGDGPVQTEGTACPCCAWFGDLMNECCSAIGGVCSSFGECGGVCSDCGQCFGECGNGCNGCGSSCSGCSNCDCSGCGDCGNACAGCGDCGNACSGCGECGNCGGGCGDCGNCGNCGGGGCNC